RRRRRRRPTWRRPRSRTRASSPRVLFPRPSVPLRVLLSSTFNRRRKCRSRMASPPARFRPRFSSLPTIDRGVDGPLWKQGSTWCVLFVQRAGEGIATLVRWRCCCTRHVRNWCRYMLS
ncbi:unnamed protein product, partial [Ectocarpus sp. 12 AP-2014]